MRASRSPRRSLGNFAVDMALRDMRRKPDPAFAAMLAALKVVEHDVEWRPNSPTLRMIRDAIAQAEGR